MPIVGGITASGVFLLFISVVGLIGAMKHHQVSFKLIPVLHTDKMLLQVMLFFYMVVLFFVFIIQFSCSCAALSVNVADQQRIISTVSGEDVKRIPESSEACSEPRDADHIFLTALVYMVIVNISHLFYTARPGTRVRTTPPSWLSRPSRPSTAAAPASTRSTGPRTTSPP